MPRSSRGSNARPGSRSEEGGLIVQFYHRAVFFVIDPIAGTRVAVGSLENYGDDTTFVPCEVTPAELGGSAARLACVQAIQQELEASPRFEVQSSSLGPQVVYGPIGTRWDTP